MRTSLVSSAIMQGLRASAIASSGPSVTIGAGMLRGGICNTTSNAAYFKSIPYAQPPISGLRFAPPEPLTQKYFDGIRQATAAAPACIQFGDEFVETGPTSEDW
jgi:carboxylesterase type B